jgi:hypothetical protein
MCFRLKAAVLMLALALSTGRLGAEGADTRPAPPDAAAVRKAASEVDEVYRDQLAKAHDPESKAALARSILKLSADEAEPVARFALLNKSIDVAVQAGDIDTTVAALHEIGNVWNINSLKLRTTTLTELSRHLRSSASYTALSRRLQFEAENAIPAREYDAARELNDAAVAAARKGDDPTQSDDLAVQTSKIARILAAQTRLDPALNTLKTKPADPAANFAVGRFECFVEGDWESGLRKLARGTDAQIKSLAEKELATDSTIEDQASIADGWWDLSKREDELFRRQIQTHAAGLYRKAISGMSGLTKLRAQQRIDLATGRADLGAVSASTKVELLNLTNAHEAGQILTQVQRDYPNVLKNVKRATLLWYHNGSEYKHLGGLTTRMAGSVSPSPVTAQSRSFLFWGVSNQFDAAKYLVVFRAQCLTPGSDGKIATMDVYASGEGVASRSVDAKEFKPGQWSVLAIVATPAAPKKAECRMYTDEQLTLALDRVYVYQLQ